MTLLEQLMRHEGYRRHPYRDTVDKLTVGYGRNLDDVGLSESEARYLLENDIARAAAAVLHRLPWSAQMDDARRAVLTNMALNMGIGGLAGFKKALAAMQTSDWETAAVEMLDSRWAYQVGPRAHELARQIRTGEFRE